MIQIKPVPSSGIKLSEWTPNPPAAPRISERHIAQGDTHLVKQETLIVKLDRDGHDTTDALALLATMRATQALHLQDRERILAELGGAQERGSVAGRMSCSPIATIIPGRPDLDPHVAQTLWLASSLMKMREAKNWSDGCVRVLTWINNSNKNNRRFAAER
jgi:hypothetical protein